MRHVAPLIVNDVSYVTKINHESLFASQAQHLVMLQGHVFVAGAVFGEIWVDSRSAKCSNFPYKLRKETSANGRVLRRTGSY